MAQTKTRGSRKGSSASTRSRSGTRKSQSSSQARSSKSSKPSQEVARNVGGAASKAKTPLLAGSAALAGAAGGLAIGAMRSRHSAARKAMPKPLQAKRIRVNSKDVARVARRIGTVSRHVADLTGEMDGSDPERSNGKRKSPVEVVLEGLTTRR